MLEIELLLDLAFLIITIFIYYYRKKIFENKVVRKKQQKQNKYLTILFFGLVIVIGFYYLINTEYYANKKFLEDNDNLIFIIINQFCFWIAITINIKSLRFRREETKIDFDYPNKKEAHEGEIEIGKITHGHKTKYGYNIKLRDLERHMFITGMTGSGKSTLLQNFLVNFKKKYDTPFLLVEFKGEYHYLQREIPNLLVYQVGKDFTINIFDPEGDNPEVHAERLFDIFKTGGAFEDTEYSPQMEKVFAETLIQVCKNPSKRNWKGFQEIAEEYIQDKINDTHDMTFLKSKTAVENRIRRYSLSTLKHIFERKSGLNVKEIFKHNVLLDLSSIIKIGGQKQDTLFFLNTLLKYLWDMNIENGSRNYNGIKHIIIIEDAQYFGSQATTKKSKISSYIEDIALLLRGTGECLISLATRPAVSAEILANCGIFIAFQEHMQKDYVEDLINLDENEKKLISFLDVGQCLIRVNSIGRPFLLQIPYKKRTWLDDDEISRNNKRILKKIRNNNLFLDEKVNQISKNNDKKSGNNNLNKKKSNFKNLILKWWMKLKIKKENINKPKKNEITKQSGKVTEEKSSEEYKKILNKVEKEQSVSPNDYNSHNINILDFVKPKAVSLNLDGEEKEAFIDLQKFVWEKTNPLKKNQYMQSKHQ